MISVIKYLLEVYEWHYTEKKNWLKEEKFSDMDHIDDDKTVRYHMLFDNFESMSKHIDKITKGYKQYWADSMETKYGNEESLEYHNGDEWNSEINITTTPIKIMNQ